VSTRSAPKELTARPFPPPGRNRRLIYHEHAIKFRFWQNGRTNPKSGNANRRLYLHWIQPASPFWQNGRTNPIILYSAAPIAARSPCAKSLGFDHDHSRMQVLNPVASASQSGLHRPTCEGASKRSLRYHLFGAKTKCFQASQRAVQNLSIANCPGLWLAPRRRFWASASAA
jgi:hypothetical protein